MLAFEFSPPNYFACDCCGNTTASLTRFVYQDGYAYAVYYAMFTEGHPDAAISGLIILGDWGDGATQADRVAFPFRLWADGDTNNVSLLDAAQSPWGQGISLARVLDRAEALTHPWKQEVFHITDQMVIEDREIAEFLNGR
jgi:hypothetical protein